MRVNNICCLGGTLEGVVASSVFALKCPEIRITVVDNEEAISESNLKNFISTEPELDEILRKCRNRNLFFSTNHGTSIKDADMIIIPHKVMIKTKGRGVNMSMSFGKLEEAARIIAKFSDSDKIVVEKSSVSAKSVEKISENLKSHPQHGARFQVLSNPECSSTGHEKIYTLLNPRCVMIGCQKNPNSRAAAQSLFDLYEHWVPREKIIVIHNWSAQISKVAEISFLAQKICSINALAIICEESGVKFNEIADVIFNNSKLNISEILPSLGFGKQRKAVMSLIFTCTSLNLPEAADYWESVLKLNTFLMNKFITKIKKILSPFDDKAITILGFATEKNSNDTTYSPAITVCDELLKENCNLKIYDPAVDEEQITKALDLDFVPSKKDRVKIFKDLHLSIFGSSAIIICTGWDEFRDLDYSRVMKWMKMPIVIDGHKILNENELRDTGVEYYTIGS